MARRKSKLRPLHDGFVYQPIAEHTLDSFRQRMAERKALAQPAPVIDTSNVREIVTVRKGRR